MMKKQPNIIIRMTATEWAVYVLRDGEYIRFDHRAMDKDQRREFHREFMNAFREARNPPSPRKPRRSRYNRRPARKAAA